MSHIENHLNSLKNFPLWIIPIVFSLMIFSLNSLSTSPDSAVYLNSALNIVNHKSITQISPGVFERRPLFSIFIALSFWLLGISVKSAFLITRFFFLLNIMTVFFIGSKLFNKWVGLLASLFLLTSLTYNEWSSYLLIDNILPFFLLWYFFFIFSGIEKGSIKYFILAGLFLRSSLFLKEKTIIFLSVPFLLMGLTKDYRSKKGLKLLLALGIVLLVIFALWAFIIYFSSGDIYTPLGIGKNLEHIKILYSIILFDNPDIRFIFTDGNGNFSFFSFINHLYTFYIKIISPNFPILTELLLLFGWGFTLYKAFMKSKPDILLSIFFLISIFVMAYVGNPASHRRFGDVFFLLCFSSLVIGRLTYEIIKKIFLIFERIRFLKPTLISSILVILIISLIFGTQISQSWDFYRTRASLFSGNWRFTVDSWHNDNVKNMSTWISNNIPENSKILSSVWWGGSFYFFSKGKYLFDFLQLNTHSDFKHFFDRDKLLFFDYREDFYNENFKGITEEDFLNLLKNTSAQYILITPLDNSLLPYLNDNDFFEKLHEIHMFPNPGWVTLYKVLDIKPKVRHQGVINRGMMKWLKNTYQFDKSKFDAIKEIILKKGLNWSNEDVERRIIQEIPSHLVNLRLNDKVELLGYDLIPMIQSTFEIIENDKNINQNELVSFERAESKKREGLAQEISLLKLGEKFELIFYWKCLEKIEHRYTVWGGLGKGYDSIELGHILVDESEYPTTEWKPGEIIKDISQFKVPEYFDPGEYEFNMCLYDINEGKQFTQPIGVGRVKILTPLEGAINRVREYKKLRYRIKPLNEYTEIINHLDDILNPENKKLLLQVLKELKTYKTSDPQNLEVNYTIGIGYEKLMYLKKAEEILKNILEKDGNYIGALIELGKIYGIKKMYQLAAHYLEKVPLDQDNNFEACLLLKEVYNKLGKSEKISEIDRNLRIISENSIKKSKWDVHGIKSSNPSLPWANVNIGKKIILYGDFIRLSLKIKGDEGGNVLPHLTIWLDDKLLHEGYLKDGEWNDYEFYINNIKPGQHFLKIWKRGGGPLYLGKLSLL